VVRVEDEVEVRAAPPRKSSTGHGIGDAGERDQRVVALLVAHLAGERRQRHAAVAAALDVGASASTSFGSITGL
jgi:hypothetical protein